MSDTIVISSTSKHQDIVAVLGNYVIPSTCRKSCISINETNPQAKLHIVNKTLILTLKGVRICDGALQFPSKIPCSKDFLTVSRITRDFPASVGKNSSKSLVCSPTGLANKHINFDTTASSARSRNTEESQPSFIRSPVVTTQSPSPANFSVTNPEPHCDFQLHSLNNERTFAAISAPTYASSMPHRFCSINLQNCDVVVPHEYITRKDPLALREGRATWVDDEFILNRTALNAYVQTMKSMDEMLILAWSERDHFKCENNRILKEQVKWCDEQNSLKYSANVYIQGLCHFKTRCTDLERDNVHLREKIAALDKDKSEIDNLRKLLKKEQENSEYVSRKIAEEEKKSQDKDNEIFRLQALQTATEEFERQQITPAPLSSTMLQKASSSSAPTTTPLVSSNDTSSLSVPEVNLQVRLQDQQDEFQHLRLLEKSSHIIRDASDQNFLSSFPAGFLFIHWYQEFHMLLRVALSNIIEACEEYAQFRNLLPNLGKSISNIVSFAEDYVGQFRRHNLQSTTESCGLADSLLANKTPTEDKSDINSTVSKLVLSQLQKSIYESFLVELETFKQESFPAELQDFQAKLLRVYSHEQQLQESAIAGSSFSPILDRSISSLVMDIFSRFAHFVWIAQCSIPPCLLYPVPGTVLDDARDLCDEVMSRRKKKTVLEGIVLLPALFFCNNFTRDISKSRLVTKGLSFCFSQEYSLAPLASASSVAIKNNDPTQVFVMDLIKSSGTTNVPRSITVVSESSRSPPPPPPMPLPASVNARLSTQFSTEESSSLNYCRHLPSNKNGLPNLANTCYLNAALQLCFHSPPFWHFITSPEMAEYVNANNFLSKRSVSQALQVLAQVYSQSDHFSDLVNPIAYLKSILGELQPNLFSGFEQQDAATVLRLIFQRLHGEYKEFKAQLENAATFSLKQFSVNYYRRAPEMSNSSSLDVNERARLAWRDLQQRAGNDNPVVEMLYPLRRSVRSCRVCRQETVAFDMVNILSLPIPTPEQCSMLRTMHNNDGDTHLDVMEVKQVPEDLYRITIIVQLLEDVPAMISLPMSVSLSMSLYALKQELIKKLVRLYRISSEISPSDIHFHFCALDESTSDVTNSGWKSLTLAQAVNGTGDSKMQETMRTITIEQILFQPRPNQRVLIACQLAFPAPVSNECIQCDESQYMFIDVTFAKCPIDWRHSLTGTPSTLSIPYRIAFQAQFHTLENVESAIQQLASRILPTTLNRHLFMSFSQYSQREGWIATATSRPLPGYGFHNRIETENIFFPKSYGVELYIANPDFTRIRRYNFSSDQNILRQFCNSSRILAGIYWNDENQVSAFDTNAASAAFEPTHTSSVTSRTVKYRLVQIRDLLDTERVKDAAPVSSLNTSGTTLTPQPLYPRSSTPTNLRTAAAQQHQRQMKSPQTPSTPVVAKLGSRFTLQEAIQAASLQKPLINARCQKCSAVDSVISYDYWQVGDMLLIQLQRTTTTTASTDYSSSKSKIANANGNNRSSNANMWEECDFPVEALDIRSITSARDVPVTTETTVSDDPTLFDLYGVVEHTSLNYGGNLGHFKAYCRLNTHDPKRWACFNDSSVYDATIKDIRPERAYLLCYVRRSACCANVDHK